jgi:hypothetical protein
MARILSLFIAIVVAIAFTATAPRLLPVLAENHLLLRVVRFTVILTTLTLVRALFKSAGPTQVVDEEHQTMTYR